MKISLLQLPALTENAEDIVLRIEKGVTETPTIFIHVLAESARTEEVCGTISLQITPPELQAIVSFLSVDFHKGD